MTAQVLTALIASASAIILAVASYWFTKSRERETEIRKEKLEHYKELASSLSGIVHGESTLESQKAYSLIRNKLNLIASYKVLKALRKYSEATYTENPNRATGKSMTNFFQSCSLKYAKIWELNLRTIQMSFLLVCGLHLKRGNEMTPNKSLNSFASLTEQKNRGAIFCPLTGR